MVKRWLASQLRGHARSVLLLGPRQVGKSTLLASLGPDLTVNLADPASFRAYVTEPGRLVAEAAALSAGTIFLDEVQRVPALLDVVQLLVDAAPRRQRFLLSGSSARKLRRGQANLLPGRVLTHRLDPLYAGELGSAFRLPRALAEGTLPGVATEPDPAVRAALLRSYVDSYLREEVQAEALVRDIGGYARLLDLVAASSGRIINLHALSKDAGVSYETSRRYLDVLEDTLILHRVPAWSGSDRISVVVHPKLLLFDIGVRNALLRRPLDRPLDDERGLLLDHLIGLELVRRTHDFWPEARVHHFRNRRGAEVDYVVSMGRELWAIEVKAGSRVDPRDVRSLRVFEEAANKRVRKLVLFTGPRRMKLDEVDVIPVEEFLASLPSGA